MLLVTVDRQKSLSLRILKNRKPLRPRGKASAKHLEIIFIVKDAIKYKLIWSEMN